MLDSFKELELHWDKVNQEFYQSLTGVAGETNGRKVKLYITENGEPLDLTGNNVRFYWRYKLKNYNSITTFTVTDITKGEFYFYIPTEMQGSGDVVGNIAIENAKEKSVLLSKEITIKIAESQFGTGLEETKNKADAITELILDAVPKDITASLAKKVDTSAIIDTAHGGTGASTRESAMDNLITIPVNTINTSELDTVANWAKYKTCVMQVSNTANGLFPTNYGRIMSFSSTNGISQLFFSESSGNVFHRQGGGSSAGWSGSNISGSASWSRFSDSKNPMPSFNSDSTSTGLAYTITNSLIPTALPLGYTFKFTPNVVSTSQSATLSINGGTAYPFYKFDSYTGNTVAVSSTNSPIGFLPAVPLSVTFWNNRWILNDEPLVNPLSLSTTVPLEKGGTGNATGKSKIYKAWAYSANGTDRFTTVYPNSNLLNFNSGVTFGKYYGWGADVTSWSENRAYFKKVKVIPNSQYTISANWSNTAWLNVYAFTNESDTTAVARYGYGSNGVASWDTAFEGGYTVAKDTTFTVPANVNYIGVSYGGVSTDTLTLQALLNGKPKLEIGSTATPWMPSSSESTLADYPNYMGTLTTLATTQSTTPSDYTWEKYSLNPSNFITPVPIDKGGTGNTAGNSNIYTAYSFSSDGTDRFSLKNPSYNLLDGSRDFSGTTWTNAGNTVTDGTYLGLTVRKRTLQWNGINRAYTIQEDGDYTFSAYIKSSGTGGATTRYVSINGTANGTYNKKFIDIGWTRDTVTIPSNLIKVGDVVSVRYDISELGTNYALYTAGHKWEKGTVATPWMPLQSELRLSDLPTYYGTSSTFSSIQPSKNTDYIWEKSPNSIDARLSNVENSPLPVFNADSTSTGLAYTVTNSFVPNPIPFGYSLKFIPNITSTIQTATLTINGGTVGVFRKIDPQTGTMSAVSSSNSPAGFLQAGNVYSLTYYNGYWILNDTPVLNPLSLSSSVPLEKGGTGANTRVNALKNLAFLGTSPTTVDTDTTAFWTEQGTGWAWYKDVGLKNQPSTYGHLVQYAFNTELLQLFSTSPSGDLYTRKANGTGWWGSATDSGTWKKFSDIRTDTLPINSVISNTSSTASGYDFGTWSNIGNQTVGSTVVYYWKRTA